MIRALILAGVLMMSLTACGPRDEAASTAPNPAWSADRKLVIGVVPKGATHSFWKSIHAGALRAATELGNVEILWKSGLKEDDRDSQIKVVERALQDSGWAGQVTFVGFDSSAWLVKALENGELHGLVLQDPMNMGYLGVKTMVTHLRGGSVERRIDTGSAVATRENRHDPAIKALLEPDYRKWLGEE